MPIKRALRALYPAHWRDLSRKIRFKRAGGRCQGCGRPQPEKQFHRAELAVMLSMMSDNTRKDFQEHAQKIEVANGQGGRSRDSGDDNSGRSRSDEERGPQPSRR